ALKITKERLMKREKYMGIDEHQATSVVVVLDSAGKAILETIVPTEGAAMIRLLRAIDGPLHGSFEETTQAAWLHDVIRAHVAKVIVCDPRRNKPVERRIEGRSIRCSETGGAVANGNAAL